MPRVEDYGVVFGPGVETSVAMSFVNYYHTEEVADIAPAARKCYVESDPETKLQYFSKYTQSVCFLEEKHKMTLKKCGCHAYYLKCR